MGVDLAGVATIAPVEESVATRRHGGYRFGITTSVHLLHCHILPIHSTYPSTRRSNLISDGGFEHISARSGKGLRNVDPPLHHAYGVRTPILPRDECETWRWICPYCCRSLACYNLLSCYIRHIQSTVVQQPVKCARTSRIGYVLQVQLLVALLGNHHIVYTHCIRPHGLVAPAKLHGMLTLQFTTSHRKLQRSPGIVFNLPNLHPGPSIHAQLHPELVSPRIHILRTVVKADDKVAAPCVTQPVARGEEV